MNEIVFQRLLALVNSVLWDNKADNNLFAQMDDKMWDELYHFSVRHGVMAIAFDGAMRLPSDMQPPFKLRMTWALGTEQIERKYTQILNAANDLTAMFQKEQIRMLLFKGLSLSAYYPVPSHREFGDIDIYLFGEYKKGNLLMSKAGAKRKKQYGYKHSTYYYKKVMIENHAYLLNVRDSRKISKLNMILLDILEENKETLSYNKNEILFPPPDFIALFFIIHATRHLSKEPLPLRTFCDWVLFLKAHAGEFDTERWKKTLQDAGLLNVSEAITTLAFRWLGGSSAMPLTVQSHAYLEDSISKEMLQTILPCKVTTPWKVFISKCKKFHASNKRHTALFGGNLVMHYARTTANSFISHIRHPETIFKTH